MTKGHLVLIGGGQDSSMIFEKIFELAGGKANTKMAVIPAASSHLHKTIDSYQQYFTEELGISNERLWFVPLAVDNDPTTIEDESKWKNNALDEAIVNKIKEYNVVFFVGGDQRKYVQALVNDGIKTPLLLAIEQIYHEGGVICGTSAGTNVMAEMMIAGGRSEEALVSHVAFSNEEDDGEKLYITKGIGFIEDSVTDTHFNIRGRLGRLIESLSLVNKRFGFGMGERTAIIYKPNHEIEVIGYGFVFVVDMAGASLISHSNTEQLHITNVKLHLLTHGDVFGLNDNKYIPYSEKYEIKYTPYYDRNDYHISLDVFGKFEISNLIIKYILDNEASETIGIMDYDKRYLKDDRSTIMRFVESEDTQAFFCKKQLPEDEKVSELYSGANIHIDIIPTLFVDCKDQKLKFNAVIYSSDKLRIVVYDLPDTNPSIDAKVEVYHNGNPIYRAGTDKFGIVVIDRKLIPGEVYGVKLIYENQEIETSIHFKENMQAICLK